MRIASVLILLYGLSACSAENENEKRRELLRVPKAKTQKRAGVATQMWLDEKGNLLPSDEQIAGLVLPRGLEFKRKVEFRHFYATSVPANKLHWYFSARLTTNNIRRVSGSTTYVAAKVRDGNDSTGRFDVKITPNRKPKGKSRVEIRQLAPRKPTPPLPQLMKQLKRKRGILD